MATTKANDRVTQSIVTADAYSTDKYRLLELNADVEKAIEVGEELVIVGGETQRAVLCTSSKSFYLAKEDTSNLRMLTTHMQWSADTSAANDVTAPREIVVDGAAEFHYVLQPKVPDVTQLKTLLLESPYTKAEDHASPSAKRAKLHKPYTTMDLMVELQSSKHEVLEMLELLNAFEDAGVWRVLDPRYQASVFGDILDAIIQNDWDFQTRGVALSDILQAVTEPEVVVRQCCRVYGTVATGDDGTHMCTFDGDKIALFCAKQLVQEEASGPMTRLAEGWQLDQFMDKWQLRVPEPIKVSEKMLGGLALVRTQRGKPSRLMYLPEEELPMDPKQRFDKLFQVQEKWTVAQLEPYVRALVRPGTTQAALLLKYARSSLQVNSTERLYSKR